MANGRKWIYMMLGGVFGAAWWPYANWLVFWIDEEWKSAPALIETPLGLVWWIGLLPGLLVPGGMAGVATTVFWAAVGAMLGRRVYTRRVRRLHAAKSKSV